MAFSELINRLFSKENTGESKNIAKERLKLVLVQDRANALPDEIMEELREELIYVISRYMDIDVSQLNFGLSKSDDEVALIANIPVVRIKREKDIC
ncbi:MAG: cell division topological specificity factor MinE [Bacillota bacterium]|jgi:cell division topological specificity factor